MTKAQNVPSLGHKIYFKKVVTRRPLLFAFEVLKLLFSLYFVKGVTWMINEVIITTS